MGLDPFRGERRTTVDIVVLALFGAITAGLVLWGFLG